MKGIRLWKIVALFSASAAGIKIITSLIIGPAALGNMSWDELFLLVLSILLPLIIIVFRNKVKFLNLSAGLPQTVLILIIGLALFAPLIAPYSPELIANAGECRLLPPFAVKQVVFSKTDFGTEKMIAADEIIEGARIKAVGKSKTVEYPREELIHVNGELKRGNLFYLLGTDEFGRDLFSRIIYGARISIFIGIAAAFISFLISAFLSLISISGGKPADTITNRLSEIFLSVPSLFVIIFAVSFFGSGLAPLILILGATSWMSLFKIINGEIKRITGKNYIISSVMLGMPKRKILFKEIMPLLLPSVSVNLLFLVANFIVIEASLSFLGLGTGGEYPSWGGIIESGITYLADAWWLVFAPGVFLVITILALNKSGLKFQKQFNSGIE